MEKGRNFTAKQKAKIVIEVLKEGRTFNEIQTVFVIHKIILGVHSKSPKIRIHMYKLIINQRINKAFSTQNL